MNEVMTAAVVEQPRANRSPPKPTIAKETWEKKHMVVTPSPKHDDVPTAPSGDTAQQPGIIPTSSRVVLNLVHNSDGDDHCYVGLDEKSDEVATLLLGKSRNSPDAPTADGGAWTRVMNEDSLVVAQWEAPPKGRNRRTARRTTMFGHCRSQPIGTIINNRKFILHESSRNETNEAASSLSLGPISSHVFMAASQAVVDESSNNIMEQKCIVQYNQVGSNGTPAMARFYHNQDGVYRVELELPTDDVVSKERRLALVAFVAFQIGHLNDDLLLQSGGGRR